MSFNKNNHEQCFDAYTIKENVYNCIKDGHPVMAILRGVTGSGKSFYALKLAEMQENFVIHSFNPIYDQTAIDDSLIEQNMPQLLRDVKESLSKNVSLVVVDSENIGIAQVKSLAQQAVRACYEIYVMEPDTMWKHMEERCAIESNRHESVESIRAKLKVLIHSQSPPLQWLVDGRTVRLTSFNNMMEPPVGITPSPSTSSTSSINMPSSEQNTVNVNVQESMRSEMAQLFSKQIFSLTPPPKKEVETRDCGTTVVFVDLAYYNANQSSLETIDIGEIKKDIWKPKDVVMFDRSVQATNDEWLSLRASKEVAEFAALNALFEQIAPVDINHFLSSLGYERTFRILKDGEYYISPDAFPMAFAGMMMEQVTEMDSSTSATYRKYGDIGKTVEEMEIGNREFEFNPEDWPEFYEDDEEEDPTANDAIIAAQMSDFAAEPRPTKTKADIESIKILKAKFPGYNADDIEQLYLRSDSATVERYLSSIQGQQVNLKNNIIIMGKRRGGTNRRLAMIRRADEYNQHVRGKKGLDEAQREAQKLHELHMGPRLKWLSEKRHAKQDTSEVLAQLARYRNRIDRLIMDGNTDPTLLDLHHMSSDGARDYVDSVLDTRMRSSFQLQIITGAGRRSNGNIPAIKREILALLRQKGLKYETVNDGSLLVKFRKK